MHADHIDALWDPFTTGRTNSLIRSIRAVSNDEALAVLDVSKVEVGPVSPSGAKYFEVTFESQGRTYRQHIEATDRTHAGNRVMWGDPTVSSAKVVREISRAEFERVTQSSAQ